MWLPLTLGALPVENPRSGGNIMKLRITLLLLAVAFLTPAQTQKNEVNESSETTQTLLNLEHDWVEDI